MKTAVLALACAAICGAATIEGHSEGYYSSPAYSYGSWGGPSIVFALAVVNQTGDIYGDVAMQDFLTIYSHGWSGAGTLSIDIGFHSQGPIGQARGFLDVGGSQVDFESANSPDHQYVTLVSPFTTLKPIMLTAYAYAHASSNDNPVPIITSSGIQIKAIRVFDADGTQSNSYSYSSELMTMYNHHGMYNFVGGEEVPEPSTSSLMVIAGLATWAAGRAFRGSLRPSLGRLPD